MRNVLTFLAGVVTFVAGSPVLGILPHGVGIVVQAVGGVLGVLGIRAATSSPSDAVAQWLDHLGSGWKTAFGVFAWALGAVLSPDVFAKLPAGIAAYVQLAGQVLTALGLFHAANKAPVP